MRNVAYLQGRALVAFSYTDSMRKEDGFTNRIFSKTGSDVTSGSTSAAAENLTTLASIDVAQQISINSTMLRDIAVTVSITGKGENNPAGNPWNPDVSLFRIVNDEGGRPGSLMELELRFVLDIENGETKPIFLQLPQAHQLKYLKPGDKAWLIMQEEAQYNWTEEDSDDACGHGDENMALRWHHDGGNTGISAIRTVCYRRPSQGGGRTPRANDTTSGWVINNAGPTYAHTFFDSFSHIIEASDQESINKYGEVDSFIDATFLTDENAMNQYLSSILQFSAKPRRIYEFAEVFIPYYRPIEPGSLVTVIDTMSGHTLQMADYPAKCRKSDMSLRQMPGVARHWGPIPAKSDCWDMSITGRLMSWPSPSNPSVTLYRHHAR